MTFAWERVPLSRLGWLSFAQNDDPRGWLAETFNQEAVTALGLAIFGQDNASFTRNAGVVRGLHFQRPPFAQSKLLRVVRGAIFNVAVDLIAAKPQAECVRLAAGETRWLHLPAGVAHGFQSLAEETEIVWKLSGAFAPEHAQTLAYDDPALKISWPRAVMTSALSERDRGGVSLAKAIATFAKGG